MTRTKVIFFLLLGFWVNGSCPAPTKNATANIPCIWPCNGIIIGFFGQQEGILGDRLALNKGLDIEARRGSEVRATAAGAVMQAEVLEKGEFLVVLNHDNDYTSRYSGLGTIRVKSGDKVVPAQPMGTLDPGKVKNDLVTLHFEVYYKGVPQDPMKLISPPLKK